MRGRTTIVAAIVAVSSGLVACGSNDKASTTSGGQASTGAAAPESRIAPDAVVTAGLKRLQGVAARVASAPGGSAAKVAVAGLEPIWMRIEGTVKRNEPNLYVDVEDSLALLSSGEAQKARSGLRAMERTVRAYLAKHPG
jgi:hypothetical protein